MAKGDILQVVNGGPSNSTVNMSFAATPNNGDLLIFITSVYSGSDANGCAVAGATELSDSADTGQTGFRRLQIFGRVAGVSETNSYAVTATEGIWKDVIAYRVEGAFTDLTGIVAPAERYVQYITSLAIPAAGQAYSGAVRAIVAASVGGTTVTFPGFGTTQVNGYMHSATQTFSESGSIQTTATFAAESNASGAMVIIPLAAPDTSLAGAGAGQATATGALQDVGLEFTLRDIDSGTVKNAVTYARVDVHLASDLSLVKTFTNITTSVGGLMQLIDPLLETVGANYFVVGWNSSGTDRFHANATVAGLS